MLLAIACLFATAAAGPVTYDQRQDGEFNAQVDISNLVFVFAIPKKVPGNLFDIFSKSGKPLSEENESIQDRADVRVMEAFVEPSTPYRVEIGSNERSEESSARAVEVVIAGRRRLESDADDEEGDLWKPLGATENCGPGRVRDLVTLMCRDKKPAKETVEPEAEIEQKEDKVEPVPEVIAS